jgi:hypothetical protein
MRDCGGEHAHRLAHNGTSHIGGLQPTVDGLLYRARDGDGRRARKREMPRVWTAKLPGQRGMSRLWSNFVDGNAGAREFDRASYRGGEKRAGENRYLSRQPAHGLPELPGRNADGFSVLSELRHSHRGRASKERTRAAIGGGTLRDRIEW